MKRTAARLTNRPRVSVLMSAYKAEKYLAKAIESILSQTFRDFEFLICNDASPDGSLAIIRRYARRDRRIVVVENKKNLGLTATLNVLLRKSSGEYIARMDADDISHPSRFAQQVAFLDRNPAVGIVGSFGHIIDERGRRIGELRYAVSDREIRSRMMQRSQFAHPAVMYRKSVVAAIGEYDEEFRSAQDYEFFPRVLTKFKGANIPRPLISYRWDFSQNEGFTNSKRQERNALHARWRMLTRYGWPAWHVVYLIKPLVSYCIPAWLKRRILARIVHRARRS